MSQRSTAIALAAAIGFGSLLSACASLADGPPPAYADADRYPGDGHYPAEGDDGYPAYGAQHSRSVRFQQTEPKRR